MPIKIHVAQQDMLLNTHYPNISLRSLGITRPKHLYMVFYNILLSHRKTSCLITYIG